jgi:hypothetical protein
MTPETIKTLLEIAGEIAGQIWEAIQRGDEEELRRLSDVWPEPTRSRLSLLAAEEKARARVRKSGES